MGSSGDAAVAVAIVSWNTRELLERCLASLEPEASAGRAEVWVVDNGSADGSLQAARAHDFAHVVDAGENLGFAMAVNRVAEATATPWLACANADVALTPGALERLLAAGDAHPRAGAVAPRLVLPDGTTQHSVHAFPTVPALALYNSGIAHLVPTLGERRLFDAQWDPARPREVDWALGAFLLIRRAAWQEVGGFEARRELYAEDLDLGWRLSRAGWRTWYEPSAVVEHDESAATRKAWGARREVRRTTAMYAWLRRRRGMAQALAIAELNIAGATARTLVTLLRDPRGTGWKLYALRAVLHARAFGRAVARRQ